MELSTHKVEVVEVCPEKHPNADALYVAKVFGYTCVMAIKDWQPRLKDGKCLAAYIPPDSTVPVNRPEFAFLERDAKQDGRARIRAKKIRNIVSFGLLIPAPEGSKLGDDVAEQLRVEHYEPPSVGENGGKRSFIMGGEVESAPNVYFVKYDVDAFRRYNFLFKEGEEVMVTEKVDGANSRFVFHDGKMHCGSRTEWKREFPTYAHLTVEYLTNQGMEAEKAKEIVDRVHSKPKKKNLWWEMLEKTPTLEKFCRDNPGMVVYGETFGHVSTIKYGLPDLNRFVAFDIMKDSVWMDALQSRDMLESAGVPVVPILTKSKTVPYNFELICGLAEGNTEVSDAKPGVIREGCVVKPVKERWTEEIGRLCLKAVSGTFLEKHR